MRQIYEKKEFDGNPPGEIRDLKGNGKGACFLDGILRKALQQNYNSSISGGMENSTYMVSALIL